MKNWNEKYRPKWFEDVAGNKEIIETLKGFSKRSDFPHILFSGTAGIGKTTLSHVFVNEVFRNLSDEEKQRKFIEFNASDKRGIDFVRGDIIEYAMKSNSLRIIILDEADELTSEAQDALKRTMEIYQNCRFILTCNNKNKIIDPILSRCTQFDMLPLNNEDVKEYLTKIVTLEKVTKNYSEGIENISKKSNGDMRTAINLLYNLVYGNFTVIESEEIIKRIGKLINFSIKEDLNNAVEVMKDLIKNYNFKEIIYKMRDRAIDNEQLNIEIRYKIILLACEMEYRYNIGVSDYTLLSYFIAKIREK